MRTFSKILILLIIAVATVFGVYKYTEAKSPAGTESYKLTTVSKPAATEKYANKRLLATTKNKKYQLYATNDKVILTHDKKNFEFKLWSNYMELEKPKMYNFDIDDDKREDVIVRCVSGQEQGTGAFVYDVYILRRTDDKDENYELITATQNTWHKILDNYLIEQVSQLKTCNKYVQFAMTLKNKTIVYDNQTGIATKNVGYVGFGRALQNANGKYLTVDYWSKGKGSYYINKDNRLCCEVEVLVNYKDYDETQYLGNVYFEMKLNEIKELYVTSSSMVFTAKDEYKVSDPRTGADSAWKTTLKNSAKPKGKEVINWIKYSVPVDSATLTQTLDLSGEDSDISYVDSVIISEKELVMTAKNGYTFDSKATENNDFSLTINKGADDEYEISYTAKLSDNGKTITISYDKTYSQPDIRTLDISFGAK